MLSSSIVIPESKGIPPLLHSNDITLFTSSTTAIIIATIQQSNTSNTVQLYPLQKRTNVHDVIGIIIIINLKMLMSHHEMKLSEKFYLFQDKHNRYCF